MNLPEGAKLCSWCSPRNVRGDGNGRFTDTDCMGNFYYPAIPICGGCGGLGIQFEDNDFKKRTSRILNLRFRYYPRDTIPEEPENIMIYMALKDLIFEVGELTNKYGFGLENSFARNLVTNPFYGAALRELEKSTKEIIENIRSQPITEPLQKDTKPSLIKLYSGDIKAGKELFQKVLKKYPESSIAFHDFGLLIIKFERNLTEGLPFLLKAVKLQPQKALHFYQAGKTLALLERGPEALQLLKKVQKQPDYKEFLATTKIDVGEMIATAQGMHISTN